jgi:hypothetical protein
MLMTIGHYIGSMEKLTRQWTATNFRDPSRQRLYLKDIDCPEAWYQHLKEVIPQNLFYWNDCVGGKGGPGASQEKNAYDQIATEKGIGPAGDLMSNLPAEMRADNLMCYIGHEGTYTPAHREMCASLGQNLMVETSEADKGEKEGSSIWFMTESKDRQVVSEYFLSMLGHDIEVESHFAQINAWKKAPFPVYIVEQKIGDFILIPPLAPHQVWNRGTRTMKVAWNRTTVETLELALQEALPRARMVCRDEQYKNKAIVYYSLLKYHDQLIRVDKAEEESFGHNNIKSTSRVRQLQKDFKRLFALYSNIIVNESFSLDLPVVKHMEYFQYDGNFTCSYCRCNIFNRFLTCKTCVDEIEGTGEEDTYDICMDCYAMGRSCGCQSNFNWVEQWKWPELVEQYEKWRTMVIDIDAYANANLFPSLAIAQESFGKKTIAQVCQEQLKIRPWRDITKPSPYTREPSKEDSDSEPETDDKGRPKKKKVTKRKSQQISKETASCHICLHREWRWKLAFCTTCTKSYCYGTLWRAFDMKPQEIMENPNWSCPKCLKICSCGACRKDPKQSAYRPKGTLLGHDTKKVADPRSIEILVDFSKTNLGWLRGEGDDNPQSSLRMQKLMEKAQEEKTREDTLEDDTAIVESGNIKSGRLTQIAIDPQLRNDIPSNEDGNSMAGGATNNLHGRGQLLDTPGEAQYGHHARDEDLDVDGLRHNNSEQHYADPAATMLATESSYPDPSKIAPDSRMIGKGYHQLGNSTDRMLFDDPNMTSPPAEASSFAQPRLPKEVGNTNTPDKKRKRKSEPRASDEGNSQFMQAQKKKLSDAKKNEPYFVTQQNLEGGGSKTVKFPMSNSKDFLKRLDDLNNERQELRRNPHPNRKGIDDARDAPDHWQGAIIVKSDLAGEVSKSVYLETSEEPDDSIIGSANALRTPRLTSKNWNTRAMIEVLRISSSSAKNNSGQRSRKSGESTSSDNGSTAARKVSQKTKALQGPHAVSHPHYKNPTKVPRVSAWLERKKVEEAKDFSKEFPAKSWSPITSAEAVVEDAMTPFPTQEPLTREVFLDGHGDIAAASNDYTVFPPNGGLQHYGTSALPASQQEISEGHRKAKLQALRMIQGESEDEFLIPVPLPTAIKRMSKGSPGLSVTNTKVGSASGRFTLTKEPIPTPYVHILQPNQGISSTAKMVLPPAPPSQMLSMKERLALRKDTTKKGSEMQAFPTPTSQLALNASVGAVKRSSEATSVSSALTVPVVLRTTAVQHLPESNIDISSGDEDDNISARAPTKSQMKIKGATPINIRGRGLTDRASTNTGIGTRAGLANKQRKMLHRRAD